MQILAIDTSAAACSVALWRDDAVQQARYESMPRGQDTRLLPLIQEVLTAAHADFAALDRIAVTRGPGSFTGIRIGLAAARGLGLALHIPVIGIDRFRLYHATLRPPADHLVILDSRRDELFCHVFPATKDAAEPFRATISDLAGYDRPEMLVSGDGAGLITWKHAALRALPETEAGLAAALAAQADPHDPAGQPLPLYLRPPDVSCGPPPPLEEAPL